MTLTEIQTGVLNIVNETKTLSTTWSSMDGVELVMKFEEEFDVNFGVGFFSESDGLTLGDIAQEIYNLQNP